jgi:hypothetical protein
VRVSLGFQRFFQMFTSLREKPRIDSSILKLRQSDGLLLRRFLLQPLVKILLR